MAGRGHDVALDVLEMHATSFGNRFGHLGLGQNAAMSRLGTLRELELDHLHLLHCRRFREAIEAELPVFVAAAEVARANVPHNVSARPHVEARDSTLACVVVEIAHLGGRVECQDCVVRKGTVAHARDVEERGTVGLRAFVASDHDPRVLVRNDGRPERVVHPLVAVLVDVPPGAEGEGVLHVLGTGVHDAPVVPAERHALRIALDEVLPDLGPDGLEEVPDVAQHGEVVSNCVRLLADITDSDCPVEGCGSSNGPRYQGGRAEGCHRSDGGRGYHEGADRHEGLAAPPLDPVGEAVRVASDLLLPDLRRYLLAGQPSRLPEPGPLLWLAAHAPARMHSPS
mmetsp:Transcript_17827/g.69116  ORF Transcript_17827/g.69116 Transcript_17827/m.69116 type:complete len:341 (+) Transcript_17827:2535-3557(+)